MTKIELMKTIADGEGTVITAEMATKAAEIVAADAAAKEKRKGKVNAKDLAKREANEALAAKVAAEILGAEAMTASDVAAAMEAMLGEEVKVQKASYICRLAVSMGAATQTEVKLPKKGTLKAYTRAE